MKNNKGYYILLGVLGLLLIIYMVAQGVANRNAKKSLDQGDSFSRHDKIMYGSFAVYDLLGDIFPQSSIAEIKTTASDQAFDFLLDGGDSVVKVNYIFINNQLRDLNYSDVEDLLWLTERGNYVFLAARIFPDHLVDSLAFDIQSELFSNLDFMDLDSLLNELQKPEAVEQVQFDDYFAYFDETITEVLDTNQQGNPNLIKIAHGEGAFILSTVPNMFTNYHLLHTQHDQRISQAFSHLPPNNNVWWDEYYKARYLAEMQAAQSPLQYIFSQDSLTWAYWLIVLAVILYTVFETKRKQRIVPIIKPLPNSTLEFTETIGHLYHQSGDHKNIADKKIKILLTHIRHRYFLRTHLFTGDFMKSLAAKSGIDKHTILELCRMIDSVRRREIVTENELIELNAKIEEFYELSRR